MGHKEMSLGYFVGRHAANDNYGLPGQAAVMLKGALRSLENGETIFKGRLTLTYIDEFVRYWREKGVDTSEAEKVIGEAVTEYTMTFVR